MGGQHFKNAHRVACQPCNHDVGIGVVVHTGAGRSRVPVVVFVGTHHLADVVAVFGRVVLGHRGEQAHNFDDEFTTLLRQPLSVGSRAVVLPRVVRHGKPHVVLPARVVGHPSVGAVVPQFLGCFFTPV